MCAEHASDPSALSATKQALLDRLLRGAAKGDPGTAESAEAAARGAIPRRADGQTPAPRAATQCCAAPWSRATTVRASGCAPGPPRPCH